MKRSNFDQLLKRYLADEVSESERIKIDAWLDVMKTENTKDLELNREDEERLFKKIISEKDNLDEIKAFTSFQSVPQKMSHTGWILRIAAAIIFVCLVGLVAFLIVKQSNDRTFLAGHDVEKIILNDGTLVWLQKDSKLTFLDKLEDGIRYTELKGEALFEVAKDADHPFHIKCNGAMIKVLGTSFNLKANDHTVEVSVLTGKVNISTEVNAGGVDVEPNQKAALTSNGKIEKAPMGAEELFVITEGTEYRMNFADAGLEEVFKRIEEKFDVTIKMPPGAEMKCKITADLTDQSLEHSLETIEEIVNVKFEITGKVIVLTGSGC